MKILNKSKKVKKPNPVFNLEVTEKELIVLATLVARTIYEGSIISKMYDSLEEYAVHDKTSGNIDVKNLVEWLNETYGD